MILKHKDDLAPFLAEVERLLALPSITKAQRADLEEELWKIRVGAKGEKETAYHLDFAWKDGKSSVIIHDLRIEHDGRVAQIDHLILTRALHCHVIESKGFNNEVRISESGEWETRTRYGWRGVPSPIEQNRRHIEVLKAFIKDRELAPKRLGISLPLSFQNWVLVSPGCHLRRKGGEWDQVVKMDMFEKRFERWIEESTVLDTLAAFSKFVSRETLNALGQSMVAAHKPASFDFAAKFGIALLEPNDDSRFGSPDTSDAKCESCAVVLEAKVIKFSRLNSKKFGGKLLCQSCQKVASRPGCDGCGTELEDKVIAFCRFNSKRLNGRRLCRSCQTTAILGGTVAV